MSIDCRVQVAQCSRDLPFFLAQVGPTSGFERSDIRSAGVRGHAVKDFVRGFPPHKEPLTSPLRQSSERGGKRSERPGGESSTASGAG